MAKKKKSSKPVPSISWKNKVFRLPKEILRREVNGSVDVMKINDYENWYSLDGLSGVLYSRFDGRQSLEKHLAEIEKEYQVPSQWNQHVPDLIQDLLAERLLEEI